MKYLLATVAIAAMIASPVAAQASSKNARNQAQAQNARAQIASPDGRRHSTNPAHDVYDSSNQYVGSDPDERVRMDLLRDRVDN
jgi:type II secretory pathway pseudopilin PulG